MISSCVPKPYRVKLLARLYSSLNRSPSIAINFRTLIKLWCGKPPNLSNLRIFGYAVFAHQKEGKRDPRSRKGVFIGYPSGVKGYRIWLKGEPSVRIVISRDVVFNEYEMPCLKDKPEPVSISFVLIIDSILIEVESNPEPSQEPPPEPET